MVPVELIAHLPTSEQFLQQNHYIHETIDVQSLHGVYLWERVVGNFFLYSCKKGIKIWHLPNIYYKSIKTRLIVTLIVNCTIVVSHLVCVSSW